MKSKQITLFAVIVLVLLAGWSVERGNKSVGKIKKENEISKEKPVRFKGKNFEH